MYDRACDKCEAFELDLYEPVTHPDPVCACGGSLKRYLSVGKRGVIQDSIEGGIEIRHGICNPDGTPKRYYSKSEIRAAAAAKGLVNEVRHVTDPKTGSDKNPHTVRWVSISPITEEERLKHWHESDPELSQLTKKLSQESSTKS